MEQSLLHPNSERRPSKLTHYTVPWILEGISLVFSMACTFGVLVLLSKYDGQPIPNWPLLTLNSIISILSAFAHAALMFPIAQAISQCQWLWLWRTERPVHDLEIYNCASRGPMGSLLMLVKPRLWHVSSLGAFLTILGLGMQPFLQLLPAYVATPVPLNGTASISKAFTWADGGPREVGFDYPSVDALSALYEGIYRDAIDEIVPVCPTGNCTWPQYTSLGVCSSCGSLSEQLRNITNPQDSIPPSSWTLPNGLQMNTSNVFAVRTSTDLNRIDSVIWKDLQAYSMTVSTFLYYPDIPGGAADVDDIPHAYECALYFCVRTYNTSMVSGNLTEEITKTWPMSTTPSQDLRAAYAPNAEYPSVGVVDSIQPPGDVKYLIMAANIHCMQQWFSSHFNTWIRATEIASDDATMGINQSVIDHNGPEFMMNNIALSLSKYMRTNAAGSELQYGDAYVDQTFVALRWKWAALPLALLALALIFLLLAILVSSHRGVPTWKSSMIPPLAYRLDDEVARKIVQEGPLLRQLEQESEKQEVVMIRQERSWRLGRNCSTSEISLK